MAAVGVVEHVVAGPAHHAQLDVRRGRAVRDRPVVPALQEDAHFVRLLRVEVPAEVGAALARTPPGRASRRAGAPPPGCPRGRSRAARPPPPGSRRSAARPGAAARAAALILRASRGAVDRVAARAASAGPPVDDRVGQRRLEVARRLLPLGPREARQEAPVHEPGLPGEAEDARILLVELHQARCAGTDDVQDQPVEVHERQVAVLRYRHPATRCAVLAEVPLVLVAVVVADQQVEEAGMDERHGVELLARVLVHRLPQLGRLLQVGEALEAGGDRRLGARILFERAQQARELLLELAEPGIVGQHHQQPGHDRDAGGARQRVDHQGVARVGRADLVLHDVVRDTGLQRLRQDGRGVLVERAELPLAPVAPLQLERLRLLAAAFLVGPEPARERRQVQQGGLDRRRPERAVARPQKEPVEGVRAVALAGDDGDGLSSGVRRVLRGPRNGSQQGQHDHDAMRSHGRPPRPASLPWPRASPPWPRASLLSSLPSFPSCPPGWRPSRTRRCRRSASPPPGA